MATTAVGVVAAQSGVNKTTLTNFRPVNVGDLVVLFCNPGAASNAVTSIAGGGVDSVGWKRAIARTAVQFGSNMEIWYGRIGTASGAAVTITVTWGTPANLSGHTQEYAAMEFASGLGVNTFWTLDVANYIENSVSSVNAISPSLAPAVAGETAFFFHGLRNDYNGGAATGYTFGASANFNGISYNPSCTAAAQQVTATQTPAGVSTVVGALFRPGILAPNNGAHAVTSSNVVITIASIPMTAVASDAHAVSSTSPVLVTTSQLVVANAGHALSSTALALVQVHHLLDASAGHGVSSSAINLAQVHILTVANAAHGVTSDHADLAGGASITVIESSIAVTSSNIVLVQQQSLVVANAAHALTSTGVVVARIYNLAVQGSGNALTSGNAILVQQHHLASQNANHSITSTNVFSRFKSPDVLAIIARTLVSPDRIIDFRYERYNKDGDLLGDFPDIASCTVTHDALSDMKRTAKLKIKNSAGVDWINDQIKPWMRMRIDTGEWFEWPLGLFYLSSPTRTSSGGEQDFRAVDAYCGTVVLNDDKIIDRLVLPAGANVTYEVSGLLLDAGIALQNVVYSDAVLPAPLEWPPGTSKMSIINNLLGTINYGAVWFDGNGYAIVRPYQPPGEVAPIWDYFDDQDSILFQEAENTLDLFEVPNRWVLIVSEADRPALTSTYTNDNPNSPTSTVSRGRVITEVVTLDQSVDQDTLDAKAKRQALESSQVYQHVTLNTGLMPMHQHLDILRVRFHTLDLVDIYEEMSWEMPLVVGGTMKHTLRRLVDV